MSAGDDPNAGQREFWRSAEVWIAQQERLDAQLSHIGLRGMEAVTGLGVDAAVLDVGCGCGQTTLQWSARLPPRATVLGIDISEPFLDVARTRALDHTAAHPSSAAVSFEAADAQTADLAALGAAATGRGEGFAGFDAVFSRFGVMFFADPVAAFANLRQATARGGQLGFVCWQGARRNPGLMLANRAVLEIVELPPDDGPRVDPFAFADTELVTTILADAGWTNVALESFETEMRIGEGETLDQAVENSLDLGIARRALAGHPPEVHDQARAAVRDALAPFETDSGLAFPAAAWIATAHS